MKIMIKNWVVNTERLRNVELMTNLKDFLTNFYNKGKEIFFHRNLYPVNKIKYKNFSASLFNEYKYVVK